MVNWFQIALMAAATPFVLLWVYLYMKYQNSFNRYIESLSADDYTLPELFFIGMGFIHLTHYNLHSRKGRARIKEISEIKGRKYAEYYADACRCDTERYVE